MKIYQCDECRAETRVPIVLSGVSHLNDNHAGILLPTGCIEWHFCGNECCARWVGRMMGVAEQPNDGHR